MHRDVIFIIAALCLVGLTIAAFNMAGRRDVGTVQRIDDGTSMQLSPGDAKPRVLRSPLSSGSPRTTAPSSPSGSPFPAGGTESSGQEGQIVVALAARTDASLSEAGSVREGDLVLVDDTGAHPYDSGDLRRGSVTLRFGEGATVGWLALRRDGITFEGADVRAFFAPDQPGYRRGVFEDRPGIRVRAGDRIELALVPEGGLSGNVWQGRGDSPSESTPTVSRVRVVPGDAADPMAHAGFTVPSSVRLADVDHDGSFEVRGLEPGVHRVEFLIGSLVVTAIHDVEIHPGDMTQDPRLVDVDLMRHVARTRYSVVDGEGAAIPDASITVYAPSGAAVYSSDSGPIEAWVPEAEPDSILVVAEAPEHAPTVCSPPFVDATVTLAPRTAIELGAQAEFERQTTSHGFRLRLRREDTDAAHAQSFAVEIPWSWNGAEPIPLELPGIGRYELEVMVLQRMGSQLGQLDSDRFVPTGIFLDVPAVGDRLDLEALGDLMRFAAR